VEDYEKLFDDHDHLESSIDDDEIQQELRDKVRDHLNPHDSGSSSSVSDYNEYVVPNDGDLTNFEYMEPDEKINTLQVRTDALKKKALEMDQ